MRSQEEFFTDSQRNLQGFGLHSTGLEVNEKCYGKESRFVYEMKTLHKYLSLECSMRSLFMSGVSVLADSKDKEFWNAQDVQATVITAFSPNREFPSVPGCLKRSATWFVLSLL